MEQTEVRPKIEIVRVPSIERSGFRPLDGVQLRAAYSHVRIGTYCPEPEPPPPEPPNQLTPVKNCDVKPPIEHSRKYKKNLGPVSRLLKRRHHATSLATKSCDNIYSVNKTNSFFEWKHGQSCNDQGLHGRQSNSLDWRVGRTIDKNSSSLDRRKASRSAEQLSRSGNLQTPSTKSKIVSLLRRLSPRLPRPSSKGSLPTSPSLCPWVQVEYSSVDATDGTKSDEQQLLAQESEYSFQRELQLNEMRKRAMKISNFKQELLNDATLITKEKKSPRSCLKPNVQIQDKQDSNPSIPAVHEDRGSSEERYSGSGGVNNQRHEVADLLATDQGGGDGDGGGDILPLPRSRRSRPHSLAVQPLNYQRFDPDQPIQKQQQQQIDNKRVAAEQQAAVNTAATAAIKHPNMTSQESIGSCSLDVEKSASDRSEINAGSLSEKTLHSLNLSCNGNELTPPAEPIIQITKSKEENCEEEEHQEVTPLISNGHDINNDDNNEQQQQLTTTTSKKPSYLGLACSISGYSGITRYDSKLREGFRSRDSSPGARLITRDTSPAGFRSNETLSVPSQNPPKSQSISPLAMERHHNGFTNGVREKSSYKIESYMDHQGYSEVDRATITGFTDKQLSPIRPSSPNKRNSPVGMRIAAYNQQNKSFNSVISSSSPKSAHHVNVSHTSFSETSIHNGSSDQEHHSILNSSSNSEKSFIQQRVERLYGPGALAQGFFFKRSVTTTTKLDLSNTSDKSSINNNTTYIDEINADESLKNLPVLRHLRPEFRAQLPVVSPRRPTDGTEQIIKPLKRITISPAKNDAKEVKASPVKQENNNATLDSKMTASVTSLTDQQPAAPKVVLPVLEPSASLTNIPKQGAEATKKAQEKDGHYFMNLLDKERSRLISLAEGAEAELSRSASDLPEEAAGKLRSAAGKARLLASQKMKQFEGLCQKNINQVPGEEFPTTSEDLAGFWDMVMLQVVQVNDLFEHLEQSRKSQWREIVPEQKSTPSTPQNGSAIKRRQTPASKSKSAADTEAARKAREAREKSRRQLIEERRRAMRANANKSDNSVEIFVPET